MLLRIEVFEKRVGLELTALRSPLRTRGEGRVAQGYFEELSRRQALEAEFLSGQFEFFQRVYLVGKTFTGYWTVSGILQLALFCLFLASIIWVGMIFVRNRRLVQETIQTKNFTGYELGLFFVCLAGLSIFLYLTYVSPIHAMTERHMSAVWPFYPFLAILLLRLVREAMRSQVTILLGTAVLLVRKIKSGHPLTRLATIFIIRHGRRFPSTSLKSSNDIANQYSQ